MLFHSVPHLFLPRMCMFACKWRKEGEINGFENIYCYARRDVTSSVMIEVWQRLHRKLLLFNSNARKHKPH